MVGVIAGVATVVAWESSCMIVLSILLLLNGLSIFALVSSPALALAAGFGGLDRRVEKKRPIIDVPLGGDEVEPAGADDDGACGEAGFESSNRNLKSPRRR